MSVLTQDLSKRGKLSQTARINFAEYDKKKKHVVRWVVLGSTALLVLSAILYFGVIIRFQEVYNKNLILEDVKSELVDVQKRIADANYETIRSDYIRYSYQYLNDTEKGYADRGLILDKMESKMFRSGLITSFSLSGNQTSLTISGIPAEECAKLKDDLLNQDPDHLFKEVTIHQISGNVNDKSGEDTATMNVTITFNTEEERAEAIKKCKLHDHSDKEESK